jgi:hypothetical protein
MKSLFSQLSLSAALLAAASWTAAAAPLQRSDLPAEPAWVLHLDFDGLRATTIGKHILSEMAKPEADARLAAFQSIFSIDLRTQLHGATLYNTGNAPENGVLLLYADFDSGRLVTLAKAARDYQAATHNQHVIHNWIDEKRPARNGVTPRTYAAIEGSRIILGQREAAVAAALDILDHASPSLAGSNSFPVLGAAGSSSYIQAAARKFDVPNSEPHAALFRLAQGVTFDLGEIQQQVTARLNLQANDEEVAKHMTAIGQGVVSLMKLQKEKPESVKMAEALSVKQDGAMVVGTLSLPANDVVELMKAHAARNAQHKAAN